MFQLPVPSLEKMRNFILELADIDDAGDCRVGFALCQHDYERAATVDERFNKTSLQLGMAQVELLYRG